MRGVAEVNRVRGSYQVTFHGRPPLRPVARPLLDFRERIDWLDAEGLRRQVVAPWIDLDGQGLPAGPGADWARCLNDSLAEAVSDSGGRLLANATVHLADPDAAAAELERAVGELGMAGCQLPSDVPGGDLADRRYDVLWQTAVRLGVPLLLHPAAVGPASGVTGIGDLAGVYGRPLDTTLSAARLVMSGLFDRHPGLRVVLAHGGGMLPYQAGRLDRKQAEGSMGRELSRLPSDYLRRFFYDSVLLRAEAIRFLVDFAGPGQVVLGSDYPFSKNAPPLRAPVSAAGFDEATSRLVIAGNADRVYWRQQATL